MIGWRFPELGGGDTAVSGSGGQLELAGAAGERWILPPRSLGEDCVPRRIESKNREKVGEGEVGIEG